MPQPYRPEQEHRTEYYRGVKLSAWAFSTPAGRWYWTYLAGDMQGRSRAGAVLDG